MFIIFLQVKMAAISAQALFSQTMDSNVHMNVVQDVIESFRQFIIEGLKQNSRYPYDSYNYILTNKQCREMTDSCIDWFVANGYAITSMKCMEDVEKPDKYEMRYIISIPEYSKVSL